MNRERAPGQYSRQFRATTEIATGKQVKGDDGLPTRRWDTAADLMERVTYVGDLERLDGRWTAVLQWVDLDNEGHRIMLPHEVIERLLSHAESIMKQARSDRSRNGAVSRAEKKDLEVLETPA